MAKKEKAPKVKKEKKVRTRKAMNLQEFLAANFNRLRNGLILVLILMIVALYSLGLYTSKLYEGPYIDTSNAYKLAQNLLDFENSMYYGINSYDYDAIAEEMATFLDRETEISEGFEAVEAALKEEPALLERVQEAQSAYDSTVPFDNELAVLLVTMDPETGENLWEEGTEIFEESIMEPFDEAITIMLELNEYFAENACDYYNSAKLGKIVMISFIVVIAVIFIYAFGRTKRKLTRSLLYPMKEINEREAELARGNINIHVKYDDQDELGDIGRSTNHVAEVLGDMLAEANKIAAGAVSGELSVRGDVDKFEGAYRQLIEGFNSALDALTGPLYKTRDALNAIGVGNIPAEITDEVQGEFVQIVDSLNVCIRTINTLVQDTTNIANAAAMGDITTRADASVHQGAFADIINGVNHSMDILVGHMNNIPIPITIVSRDLDVLFMNKVALENTGKPAEQVHKKKCDTCSSAAICGTPDCVATVAMASGMKASRQTAVTIDGEGHLMTYTAIPLRGAKGKIVAALELATDETEITHAMNQAEADSKKAAMRADYLATQVEKVIQNLDKLAVGNLSLDTTCEAASEELADIAANFERINSNLAKTKEAIGNMITDADMMAQAAVAGKLDIRADITKHGGKYADVMVGFNNTLDAVNRPFAEALGVLDKMAAGDLRVRMTGKYEGDYNAMKLALNKTSDNMQSTVAEITKVLAGIGAGDLNQTIKGNYQGDFVAIRDSLNDILSSLNSILIQINTSAEGVAQGSKEVSHASQSLSDSSTQQASAIQQLTASVADVAGQTKQNAGDASKAAEIANSAKGSAQKGNEQMQEMLQSMHEIDQASKAISKVIKVIDDIAFQTNILALNASVEAARAGVHGKGFAVVADEVRNLAEKSANAASETTALIEGSIAKTNKGTEIANETADALKEIRNSIEESADLVMHIAEASADQAKGIEQINIGLEQVARGVQANSATSEESAAASAELYGQAATLKQLVETFKLRKDEEPAFDNLDFDTDDVGEAVEKAAPSDINLIPEDIVITLDENDKY